MATLPAPPLLLLDGGLGTTLEDVFRQKLGYPLWSATPVDKDPEAIISAHLAFLRAGVDVITTSTYQAAYRTYEIAGYSREDAKRLMVGAVKLAIEAKRRYLQEIGQNGGTGAEPSRRVKIALSLGPYGGTLSPAQEFNGFYPPPFGPASSGAFESNVFSDTEEGLKQLSVAIEALEEFHYERLEVFAENREVWDEIDFVAFETVPLRREITGIRRAIAKLQKTKGLEQVARSGASEVNTMKRWWISTVYPDGRYPEMKPGGEQATVAEVAEAALLGEDERLSVPWGFGINCTSPEFLPPLLQEARDVARRSWELHGVKPWLVLYPNGGDVYNPETHSWLGQREGVSGWATHLCAAVMDNARDGVWGGIAVGGCCKTGPDEISELRNELRNQFE
ncbi:Homocysteine S-methyltransferase [Dichomitus squalens]|uniref:Homocysteine S-methyltransferase n=1 Tax=Dichomitus squalens TaxID=114155 RepID=A0A4Q9MD92_9APHY|nr:Homocysteine S-methyltransferase [Dichomitus squalens]